MCLVFFWKFCMSFFLDVPKKPDFKTMYRTSIPSDGSLCPVWRVNPLLVFVCRAGSPETALNHSESFADVFLVNARLWRELRDIKLRHSQVWNNSQQTCVIQRLAKNTTKAAGSNTYLAQTGIAPHHPMLLTPFCCDVLLTFRTCCVWWRPGCGWQLRMRRKATPKLIRPPSRYH